jgi:hypothetical protein
MTRGNKTEESDRDGESEHGCKHNVGTEQHNVTDIEPYLVSIPVFADGHQFSSGSANASAKEHEHHSKENKTTEEDSARAVYTYPDKVFCGIVAFNKVGAKEELVVCDHSDGYDQ